MIDLSYIEFDVLNIEFDVLYIEFDVLYFELDVFLYANISVFYSPWSHGLVVRAVACEARGPGFDSSSDQEKSVYLYDAF